MLFAKFYIAKKKKKNIYSICICFCAMTRLRPRPDSLHHVVCATDLRPGRLTESSYTRPLSITLPPKLNAVYSTREQKEMECYTIHAAN